MIKRKAAHVDRTKPSTACEPCRKRRAKCDRRRPQCSQCVRSGHTCSGYRNNLDLVIRIENEKVLKAVQRKASSSSESGVPSETAVVKHEDIDDHGPSDTPEACVKTAELVTRQNGPLFLQQGVGGMAVNYFVTHFGHGVYLDWLPTLFQSSRQSPMLEASLEAVGILYLGLRENRMDMVQDATSKYSSALREISRALSIPSRAVQDDTIASVLLVALYTAWSSPASEAARAWTHHINGAMVLLDMRPAKSFNGHVVQWLLGHVISTIQLDCINRWTSLPPQLSKLCRLSVMGLWDFQLQFWVLIQDLASFRELVAQNRADDAFVVERAIALDAEATRLARIMPLPPELDTAPNPHRLDHNKTPVHYPAHRVVQAMNTLRLIRLDVIRYIIGRSEKVEDQVPDSQAASIKAVENVQLIVDEICLSVPEFLRSPDSKLPFRQDTDLWITSLLYAITFAADCDMVPEAMKVKLRRQLEIFAEYTDMFHVAKAALDIAAGQKVPEGLHIFYIS